MKTDSNLLTAESLDLCECLERLTKEKHAAIPLSTYRLQLHNNFRFEDARRLVPYLAQLGISHCYASPILRARSGSQHGYDIIQHNELNPDIGTEDEFRRFVADLHSHGMGLIVDTVPNHMGLGHGDNPWWQDVLQNGRTSVYADFFDIDWTPLKLELQNKVMLPILGNPYGEDLESGNIKIFFEDGKFVAKYFDKVLPIDPRTYPMILNPPRNSDRNGHREGPPLDVESLMSAFGRLPSNDTTDPGEVLRRQHDMPELLSRLQALCSSSPEAQAYFLRAAEAINGKPGDATSFDPLHELLERQAYRLAFWRVSGEEINYRRFFDINDLVGLRMENPRVFAETHKLFRRFLAEGLISGLRIDHPDGLLNPAEYFMRLQRLYAASRCLGPQSSSATAPDGVELDIHSAFSTSPAGEQAPLYLLIEKILERGEHLRPEWPLDGSVGYDFANLVNGVLIDHRNERLFTKLYHRIIDANVQVDKLIYDSKKLVMRRALASEVNVLTHMLNEISNGDRRARDYTRGVLREAIRETIAFFPVYRTYIDERGRVSDSDRKYIEHATQLAKRHNGTIAPAAFDFLRRILLHEGNETDGTLHDYQRHLHFTLKFQQLTGPVMAKGLEDTACYIYARFISANEVGGTPAQFGVPLAEFHRGNQERAERWPASMLATSTHDTKRSEDVRARLDVLSELPNAWAAHVMKWRRINRSRKVELADGRIVPDNNEEYFLYQTIIGAWPLSIESEEQRESFVRRLQQYMEKALHEAKINISWLNPNPEYVAGLNKFIDRILAPRSALSAGARVREGGAKRGKLNLFWDSLQQFLPPVMYFGALNSITQTLLKLTCPGVPDVYQGQEMWDFSLVDPDNRRPVDFALRMRAAAELREWATAHGEANACRELLAEYGDGRLKLWVTMQALNFRKERPDLFRLGSYQPLHVTRGREEHVIAFARRHEREVAIVAVTRLSCTLMKGREEPPIGAVWGDSQIELPPEVKFQRLRNVITGEVLVAQQSLLCREVFNSFPGALLTID